jgi:hypothetical protein
MLKLRKQEENRPVPASVFLTHGMMMEKQRGA